MDNTKIKEILGGYKSAVIVSHRGPDEDAICSMMFMRELLLKEYKYEQVRVVSNNELTGTRFERIGIRDLDKVDVQDSYTPDMWGGEELIIFVDNASILYFSRDADPEDVDGRAILIIDHHESRPDVDYVAYVNEGYISCTEQLFEIFCAENDHKVLKENPYLAFLLQVGLIADSNNLLYPKTRPESFRIMAVLREIYPLDGGLLLKEMKPLSKGGVKLLSRFLDRMEFRNGVAYSYVLQSDQDELGLKPRDTNTAKSWLLNEMMRNIEGINVCLFGSMVGTEESLCRVSMRALKGDVDLNEVGSNFNGGGHNTSAAATISCSHPIEALEKILVFMEEMYGDLSITPSSFSQHGIEAE